MVSQPSARIDKVAQNALPCSRSSSFFHKLKAKYALALPLAKKPRRRSRIRSLATATNEQYPPDWANVHRRLAEDEHLSGAFADIPQRALSLRYSNNPYAESADPFSALSDADDLSIPSEYNANAISYFWRKHPDIVATRLVELTQTAGSLLASVGWDIFNDAFEENLPAHANVVRQTLTRLGPAYIKLGQALSARPDLLPEAFISELRSLCHDVPPFPASEAVFRIEEDLGRPLHEVYAKFDPVPVAAASLGQVYRAELRGSCDTVAIKVQRPRLKLAISCDVFILRRVCMALKDMEEIRQRLCVDPVDLVDDWAAGLFSEMDYVKEARNMSAFKQSVNHLPHILVPEVYQELTTSKVLTTRWINGMHLSEVPPHQMQTIVHIGLQCYLSQLLNTGFFHSDPHPGNLMVTPNGQLAILDYGSMTSVSSEMKYALVDLLVHAFHQDYGALYTDMETIGLVEPGQDPQKVIPKLVRLLHSTTDSQPLTSDLSAEIDYAGLAHQAAALILELELKLPPSLMGIFKAVTMLEGFALEVDPEFVLVRAMYPYVIEQLLFDSSPRFQKSLKYFVYGQQGVFDAQRFINLVELLEAQELLPRNELFLLRNSLASSHKSKLSVQMRDAPVPPITVNTLNSIDSKDSPQGSRGAAIPASPSITLESTESLRRAHSPVDNYDGSSSSGYNSNGSTSIWNSATDGRSSPNGVGGVGVQGAMAASEVQRVQETGQARVATDVDLLRDAMEALVAHPVLQDMLVEEVTRGIDAVSRTQLQRLLLEFGIGTWKLPIPFAGSTWSSISLSPRITLEDKLVVHNAMALLRYLVSRMQGGGGAAKDKPVGIDGAMVAKLIPIIASIAAELMPDVWDRLQVRVIERMKRDAHT